jgi:hypothetical protein
VPRPRRGTNHGTSLGTDGRQYSDSARPDRLLAVSRTTTAFRSATGFTHMPRVGCCSTGGDRAGQRWCTSNRQRRMPRATAFVVTAYGSVTAAARASACVDRRAIFKSTSRSVVTAWCLTVSRSMAHSRRQELVEAQSATISSCLYVVIWGDAPYVLEEA